MREDAHFDDRDVLFYIVGQAAIILPLPAQNLQALLLIPQWFPRKRTWFSENTSINEHKRALHV